MRWRLFRRCLLFGLLGLVTSVAVAWGVSVRWQLHDPHWASPSTLPSVAAQGVAVVDGIVVRVRVSKRLGWSEEAWILDDSEIEGRHQHIYQRHAQRIEAVGGAAFDREMGEQLDQSWRGEGRRIDHRARRVRPPRDLANGGTYILRESVGWPAPALRHVQRQDVYLSEIVEGETVRPGGYKESFSRAIELPFNPPYQRPATAPGILLPIEPRPGLLLNTIFYGLLWALLLLAPGAIRRRIRRARGRCPKCGYLLRGQPAPGCPECGAGREAGAKRAEEVANRPGGPAPA